MRKKNKNLHRYVVGTEPGHHHNSFVLDMVDRNDVNNLAGRKKKCLIGFTFLHERRMASSVHIIQGDVGRHEGVYSILN